ncbi:Transcription initiation factor TFIID subunit 13 [Apodemus speciosus]|uniref:Transcription initiation factor TFIID subunit 13 n=2 Tax=Euarchontoglires TaxID=314146 RepID=A0ABQ0ELS2_APOSI
MADEEEDPTFEEENEEIGGGAEGGQGKRKRLFSKELDSLYSPGCPGTHSVDQADLKLRNPPASASQVLGLKVVSCILDWPCTHYIAEDDHDSCVHLSNDNMRCMMYGFGDDQNPYTESVDILEDLVIEFITEMTHKAMSIGRQGRVQVEDIVFLIRKDPRKFARVKDLLTMNEELKRARKAFDEANYGS